MTIKSLMLDAPEGMLDPNLKPLIEKWDDEPKAIQLLEVLDACIWGGAASGFVVKTLQALYDEAREKEGVSHEQVCEHAPWRNAENMF